MKAKYLSAAAILVLLAFPLEPAFAATINCSRNPISTNFSCNNAPAVNDTVIINWRPGGCRGTVLTVDLTDGLMDIQINTAGCGTIAANEKITANFSVGCSTDDELVACQVPEFAAPTTIVAALGLLFLALSRKRLSTRASQV